MNLKDKMNSESEKSGNERPRDSGMSETELILKQSHELAMENEQLRNLIISMREQTATMISSVKNEYEKKEKELDKQINETEQLRTYTQKMKSQIDKAVEHKAKQLTVKNSTACRNEYLLKIKAIYGITAAALTYSIYVTILTGINSVRFSRDLLKAIYYVITIAKLPFDIAYKVSNFVYHFKY
ncbi:hypothetical protein [Oribacterium sp. C9]|uniref:hypothetical protein n=1 Tax=Oribacterium sp. C9 TaxID=1943579 RepID=UPI001FA91CA8|nr:hypothetical protein [Oribacterium sp. C9]